MSEFIKHFSEVSQYDINEVGGKGTNLARLIKAGYLVPPGFCITTRAYREFLCSSGLTGRISSTLAGVDLSVFENTQRCGAALRQLIMECEIPENIREAILPAYWSLFTLSPILQSPLPLFQEGNKEREESAVGSKLYVAVRSSATAEDLPEMSFAGQHDSCLNIFGHSDLLHAMKTCWASLWSDRAIAYRHKHGIEQTSVLMAVVVQRMVPSTASGVLFTANPLTNNHNELVINANWGLGSSVVSGEVSPDEYIVEKTALTITAKTVARKTTMAALEEGCTTHVPVPPEQQSQACLSDEQIRQLAFIGALIEEEFQASQDIEWGVADGQLFILQSRPITPLEVRTERPRILWGNPKTEDIFKETVVFWSNLNVRETMPYPHTTLSWSFWKEIILPEFAKAVFDIDITEDSPLVPYQCAVDLVDGRLYMNMTLLYGHPVVGALLRHLFPHIDHEAAMLLKSLYQQGEMQPVPYPKGSGSAWHYLRTGGKILLRLLSAPWRLQPERLETPIRQYWQKSTAFEQMELAGKSNQELLKTVLTFNQETLRLLAPWSWAIITVIIGYQMLAWLTRNVPDVPVDKLLAAIPGNKTTEGALELYRLSEMPEVLKQIFLSHKIDDIPARLEQHEAGKILLKWIGEFLDRYGHRCAKEFDLGEPRWKENPTFVFQMIKNYLQLSDTDTTPLEHFRQQAKEREQLIKQVDDHLSQSWTSRRFPWKRWVFHKVLAHIHANMPLRENFKYYMLKSFCGSRRIFHEIGRRLQEKECLECVKDVYFLMLPELEKLSQQQDIDRQSIKELIRQRKREWEADLAADPPEIVRSDGQPVAFPEREPQDDNALTGTAVSSGKVSGKARIIRDPAEGAAFNKGDILVAPVTDPGWTPLFLTAKALVSEVGGIMCHGAVIAREYGIPAVVGVKHATTRIKTGAEITVNGDAGKVFLGESRLCARGISPHCP